MAPYSQFQNVTWDPPTVMIAANARESGQLKDTTANILETGEFVWNMATYDLKDWVLASSNDMAPGVDEFQALNIPWLPSRHVQARRVKGSPVHFECRLTQKLHVPGHSLDSSAWILVAEVVGIHIEEGSLTEDGRIDIRRIKPLARLGYRDYTDVNHSYELTELTGRKAEGISHLHETLHQPPGV